MATFFLLYNLANSLAVSIIWQKIWQFVQFGEINLWDNQVVPMFLFTLYLYLLFQNFYKCCKMLYHIIFVYCINCLTRLFLHILNVQLFYQYFHESVKKEEKKLGKKSDVLFIIKT